ncbi:MAG TPA: DegT/DnrJ/EryC1/StrS family aminotransferase [Pyrinomonadaceae bacterium]|nr:DegT/DnrJ/EryC1/StrS family aminotransferase [Pyrinomonadaceae bacterium]
MNVPLLDLQGQYQELREELLGAVTRVLDSQRFVLGDEGRALESAIAAYCNTDFAIGCASGSDALLLALMALDIKPGDEVITTPFTFFATGSAITRLGARPVFVDVNPLTYNIDPEAVAHAISPHTKAIMPVHLYGQCADMDALLQIAEQRQIPIVEDAAQALGAEDAGRRAGSLGLIGCFSFYPSKNLGGAGDGGMLTTNDAKLATRLRTLRVHGGEVEYRHSEVGINSRLDELQAAVLRVKLTQLDRWSDLRRNNARRYDELLRERSPEFEVITPYVREEARHIFHQYVLRVPNYRDDLVKHLAQNGIGTGIYYPIPLHRQECFAFLGYREGDCPEAERAARETIALPIYPELSESQQRYVIETLVSFRPS